MFHLLVTASTIVFLGMSKSEAFLMTNFQVPVKVQEHQSANFHCEFDLENATFHSARWYRELGVDREEIIRCNRDRTVVIFHFYDLLINTNSTTEEGGCNFELYDINRNNEGLYTCEISLDAPTFELNVRSDWMKVVSWNTNKESD